MSRSIAVLSLFGLLASGCATSPPAPAAGAPGGFALSLPAGGAAFASAAPAADAPWVTSTPSRLVTGGSGAGLEARLSSGSSLQDGGGGEAMHVTGIFGLRELDDDEWGPVDEQMLFGAEVDRFDPATGHGWEAGSALSHDDDNAGGGFDVEAWLLEFYGGYRHTFVGDDPSVMPYLSAGGSLIYADVDVDGPGGGSDDDFGIGMYIRGGLLFRLEGDMRLGIDYRHMLWSDIDVASANDLDFDQLTVTLGWPF